MPRGRPGTPPPGRAAPLHHKGLPHHHLVLAQVTPQDAERRAERAGEEDRAQRVLVRSIISGRVHRERGPPSLARNRRDQGLDCRHEGVPRKIALISLVFWNDCADNTKSRLRGSSSNRGGGSGFLEFPSLSKRVWIETRRLFSHRRSRAFQLREKPHGSLRTTGWSSRMTGEDRSAQGSCP